MFSEITRLTESHHKLRQLARQLGDCTDYEACLAYDRLLRAAEQVFSNEQRLMEKHDFPAIQCHLEQHARVLGALHCAHSSIMGGNHSLARRVGAQLLPAWFELHNATLDAALAAWAAYRIAPAMRDFHEGTSWRSWPCGDGTVRTPQKPRPGAAPESRP